MPDKTKPCTCEPQNIIGISDGDSVGYWRCRTCGHEWERGGYFAQIARANIDKMRDEEKAKCEPSQP